MFQNLRENFLQRYTSVFTSNQLNTMVKNQSEFMLRALSFHISNIIHWRHILLIPQRIHLAKLSQISFHFKDHWEDK